MLVFEFLNRISFFSVLTWSFFFVAVVCAILVTYFRGPRIRSRLRRYRSALIGTGSSALILGLLTGSLPYLLGRFGPDQSRLTPIDELITTEWIEPVSNPETEIVDEEVAFLRKVRYQFRYKLQSNYEFKRALTAIDNTLVVLDSKGNLHGFHAYNGLNHWQIRLRLNELLQTVTDQKRLYLLERTSLNGLRISCLDIKNPALLWQRTLPRSKEGALALDVRESKLIVSAGSSGVWALKSKSGELLWKRPEVFSKVAPLLLDRHLLAFEPPVAGKPGHWFFLNPHTGATLRKVRHSYPDLEELLLVSVPGQNQAMALARIDSKTLVWLNPEALSESWTHRSDSAIQKLVLVGHREFLVLLDQNLMELRDLSQNTLLWQKKISVATPVWMEVSPDHALFAGPIQSEGEPRGLAFYEAASGDYLTSGRLSEPVLGLFFLGDWLYLLSEHYLWAHRRGAP